MLNGGTPQHRRPNGRRCCHLGGWRTTFVRPATSNEGFREHCGRSFVNSPECLSE